MYLYVSYRQRLFNKITLYTQYLFQISLERLKSDSPVLFLNKETSVLPHALLDRFHRNKTKRHLRSTVFISNTVFDSFPASRLCENRCGSTSLPPLFFLSSIHSYNSLRRKKEKRISTSRISRDVCIFMGTSGPLKCFRRCIIRTRRTF